MFKLKKNEETDSAPVETSESTFENADATAQKIEDGYVSMDPSEYPPMSADEIAIDIRNVCLWYGTKQALFDVTMPVKKNSITALIGPSGCGKSTLLRSINRMNDLVDGCRIEGEMLFHGDNLYAPDVDINALRTRIVMIFQKPNPFPMTIRDNITYGPKIHGIKDKKELNEITSALGLSGGQQQRLCIARALSVNPEVILMDEPTSALDPIATSKIEDLALELKKDYTVAIVTHNMQQASRIGDYTGFMYLGKMIEFNDTEAMFNKPKKAMTERYLTGRFG